MNRYNELQKQRSKNGSIKKGSPINLISMIPTSHEVDLSKDYTLELDNNVSILFAT